MPVCFETTFADAGILALWEINEDTLFLTQSLQAFATDWEEFRTITHPQKQLEWLASRSLVQQTVIAQKVHYHGIEKDLFGKPQLHKSSWQLSLSHTYRYAGVAIHPRLLVGIDIEEPSEKLQKIAPKFLSEQELRHAKTLEILCVYWSGKEALYKLYGKKQLSFRTQIGIEPFAEKATDVYGWICTPTFHARYQLNVWYWNNLVIVLAVEIK